MKSTHCIIFILLLFTYLNVRSEEGDTLKVVLRANVKTDKIQLRWAVNSPAAWYFTNKNGFILVRYTITRNNIVLDNPEKKILTASPLKPKPLDDWQNIAQEDHYAAILAQALYGDSFEVSGGKGGVSQIIALSQEQQQRYAMSLLAADMSFPSALFAGWGFEDNTVKKGERYLYQVIPENTIQKQQVENGAVYAGLNDYSELPRPLDFTAVWGNGNVLFTWDYKTLLSWYHSYYLERSEDNRNFTRQSKIPLTNIMGGDRMFHTDSITNGKIYYYRLLGVTPFGGESEPSDTLSGKGTSKLAYVPFIKQVWPDGKGGVDVTWEFDDRGVVEIKGFELRQSIGIDSTYTLAVGNIPPSDRTVNHKQPLPEGYLTIAAIAREGESTISFPRLLQIEDTIPPAVPQNLQGSVDTLGNVRLWWDANTESDFYGCRIYRGQTKGGELIPLNDKAHTSNQFLDTIEIYNLNANIYYAVAALDMRYNQSALSEVIELEKPAVVKPSPPLISKYESTEQGIRLEWIPGRDETVRSFYIYRRENETDTPVRIAEINDTAVISYLDTTAAGGMSYQYHIRSVTGKFIESDASPEASVKAKAKAVNAGITQLQALWKEKSVVLAWKHTVQDIRSVSIYRKEGDEPLSLWRELDTWQKETTDTSVKRNVAYEYLLVIKNRQGKIFSQNVIAK